MSTVFTGHRFCFKCLIDFMQSLGAKCLTSSAPGRQLITCQFPSKKIGHSEEDAAVQQGGRKGLRHNRLGETLSAALAGHRAVTTYALK